MTELQTPEVFEEELEATQAEAEPKKKNPRPHQFKYDGKGKLKLDEFPTNLEIDPEEEADYKKRLKNNRKALAKMQEKLFAENKEGVIFMIQALDAAGKDGTVEHVCKGMNPGLMSQWSFKTPSKEELAHDYLWRAHTHLPKRGTIGIFNRSYYEDVLCVRVLNLWPGYEWPERCYDMDEQDFFDMRFRQIRDYERYLHENGYRLVKIFLNVSRDEQKNRFISRIDEQEKNWKFSAGDLDNRPLWDDYMEAFEDCIDKTSTKENPWYIVPADQKFVARWLVSEILLKTLRQIDPKFPELSEEELANMAVCREKLVNGEI